MPGNGFRGQCGGNVAPNCHHLPRFLGWSPLAISSLIWLRIALFSRAPPIRFERTTLALGKPCSIQLSYGGGERRSMPREPAQIQGFPRTRRRHAARDGYGIRAGQGLRK